MIIYLLQPHSSLWWSGWECNEGERIQNRNSRFFYVFSNFSNTKGLMVKNNSKMVYIWNDVINIVVHCTFVHTVKIEFRKFVSLTFNIHKSARLKIFHLETATTNKCRTLGGQLGSGCQGWKSVKMKSLPFRFSTCQCFYVYIQSIPLHTFKIMICILDPHKESGEQW